MDKKTDKTKIQNVEFVNFNEFPEFPNNYQLTSIPKETIIKKKKSRIHQRLDSNFYPETFLDDFQTLCNL